MNDTIKHLPNGDFKVIKEKQISTLRKVPRQKTTYDLNVPDLLKKARSLGYAGVPLLVVAFKMEKEEALALISGAKTYEIHGNRLTTL